MNQDRPLPPAPHARRSSSFFLRPGSVIHLAAGNRPDLAAGPTLAVLARDGDRVEIALNHNASNVADGAMGCVATTRMTVDLSQGKTVAIGRGLPEFDDATGRPNVAVPEQYTQVSRDHGRLSIEEGQLIYEGHGRNSSHDRYYDNSPDELLAALRLTPQTSVSRPSDSSKPRVEAPHKQPLTTAEKIQVNRLKQAFHQEGLAVSESPHTPAEVIRDALARNSAEGVAKALKPHRDLVDQIEGLTPPIKSLIGQPDKATDSAVGKAAATRPWLSLWSRGGESNSR